MAQIRISFKSKTGGSVTIQRQLGLMINNEKFASTDAKEAAALASAHGQKNHAPFLLDGQAALVGGGIEAKLKGSNTAQLVAGDGKVLKEVNFEAGDDAKVHVIIKKRGNFIIGLILGRYKMKVKS